MKKESKFKVENCILIPIILFAIISIITVYCTRSLLSSDYQNLFIKQGLWYLLGFAIAYGMMFFGNKFLYNNAYIFYIVGVILLILVLFLGKPINNARCWFIIPYIGSFQPSEFMKVFLMITLSRMINDFNEERRSNDISEEFRFLIKVLIVVGIPSILTFIEPDTGAVLIYFIITIVMLFVGGFRSRWFIITIGTIVVLGGMFLGLYFLKQDLFIKIFGTSFFYRMDRILNWSNSSGLQLTNGLTAIGSGGLFGHGFNHTPIYFPEMQTDFIFAVFASNFGFAGVIGLLLLIVYFDISIVKLGSKSYNNNDKLLTGGIISVLLFQQIHNISMTIGLLPIMGITLPFISYGGSSLLSYMILIGMLFNISNENLRFKN
ncbi:MAG: FtsW/RodA/SpoVE family cell cycle protein [Bacilli bacterium]|nr:FtsW/RodA/SpoVE family cell cycle protein [Bacilli bacterium]